VDCDTEENMGCTGGWPYKAFDYYKTNFLTLEETYSYEGVD
jgi:hypothetical protein